jgi:predicted regulator of Ras-like GTPase activity (Roadblock/LC7/MglB family)
LVKKKKSIAKTETLLTEESAAVIDLAEEPQVSSDLVKSLSKICKRKTVLGYIIRDASTATIDLKETEKLVDYAMLTSQALESGQELSKLFPVGELKSTVIEGRDIKAVCLIIGESKISVFMKKGVDHADLLSSVMQ